MSLFIQILTTSIATVALIVAGPFLVELHRDVMRGAK